MTIADKQPLFRVGVRHALSQQPDFEVSDSAPMENLMALIEANSPDVLLLDIDYPSFRGLDLAREIILRCPTTKVIMLASNPDDKQLCQEAWASAEVNHQPQQKGPHSPERDCHG